MKENSFLYKPKFYTLASILIGYLLIGDLSAQQQNALGNWLMTISQILEGNSAIQQAIEEKLEGNTVNINSKQYKSGGSPIMNNDPILDCFKKTDEGKETIKELKKMIDELKEKLDNLTS